MSAESDKDSPRNGERCRMDLQFRGNKGKGPTKGFVAHKRYCEKRWKGAKTDSDREDFYRKGPRRGMLKILKKGKSYDFPFFVCPAKLANPSG